MIKAEPLDWDSRFFGIDIFRISEISGEEELAKEFETLRRRGTRLVYCSIPTSPELTPRFLSRWGGALVDRRVTFRCDLDTQARLARWDDRISLYAEREPSEALIELAIESGRYSRFRTDRRLEPRYKELFTLWMENSVSGRLADAVIVYSGEDGIQGMVTVASKQSQGQIGLIAVGPRARRAGVGKLLMTHANDWFIKSGNSYAVVVTQAENREACGLYRHCGYRASKKEHTYHFWIAEDRTCQ